MRRVALGVVVVGFVVGAAACGGSRSTFVSNAAENTYFKLPDDYEVFDLPTGRQDRLSPDYPEEVELLWSKGFDGAPDASVDNVAGAGDYTVEVDEPVGIANIYQVQGSYNQQLSLTTVRSVPLGFDPLFVQDSAEDLVEIIEFIPLEPRHGLQGSRVLFNMRPTPDAPWRTYDMTTYFDPGRFRMYTFTVGCLAPCFKALHDEIRSITSSWRVEP